MSIDGPRRHIQDVRNFLGCFSLLDQVRNLNLGRGQSKVSGRDSMQVRGCDIVEIFFEVIKVFLLSFIQVRFSHSLQIRQNIHQWLPRN